MKLAGVSIHNSLLLNVISIFIVFAGIVAITNLTREAFPNISFDTVLIQTSYSGATPEEMEKLITIPLEKELGQVDHIDEMTSVSAEGYSVILMTLDPDVPDHASIVHDIQRAVDRTADLPIDLEDKPIVKELSTRERPVITVSLSGNLPESKLQDYAKTLERHLLNIEGVGKIVRDGWRKRQIRVEVRPELMTDRHVGLSEVIEAIKMQNVSVPGGNFYEGGKEFIIRTSGEFDDLSEVETVVVRSNADGSRLYVRDIASVSHGFEDEKIINKTQGTRAINLTVVKKDTGDTIDIVDETRSLATFFGQQTKDGLKVSFMNDMSYYIKRRLNVLTSNGLIGLILVVISLFVLLSLRIAISALIDIPITILASFAVMYWMGISINLLSMFGMIMVIGMLVDEEIVIAENIFRHLEERDSHTDAIIHGTAEVGRAVLATVTTTMAAFVPFFMMSGTMGKFVQNIPTIVNITLLSSLLIAVFILPAHIHHLTRREFSATRAEGTKQRRLFLGLRNSYMKLLKIMLRFRYALTGGMVLLLAVCIVFAVQRMNFILFPAGGVEVFFIMAEGEAGDDTQTTSTHIQPIEQIVATLPDQELDNYVTMIGKAQTDPDGRFTDFGSNLAQITVYLKPPNQRSRTASEIIEALRSRVTSVSKFKKISFEEIKHGPSVGKAVEVQIRGDDFTTLAEIAQQFKNELKKMPGVEDIQDDTESAVDELRIRINKELAAQAGVSVAQAAQTIRAAFEGAVATSIKRTDEEIDVVVKLPDASRYDKGTLTALPIRNDRGNLIALSKLADVDKSQSLRVIRHFDGLRTVNITANVNEALNSPIRVFLELDEKFKDIPFKYPGTSLHYGGEQKESRESLSSLIESVYIAFGLILIILVALFRSLRFSLIIVFSIPFALIGVIVAFAAHQMPLSFMALLGVVGLTGVVANSGIIIIDFIQKARERGIGTYESIMEGCELRFRPVILTSITTALGVIPAAYGIGGLDPFIQPMALALNYGLLFGTLLSLFLIPCMVAIADDLNSLVSQNMARLQSLSKRP